MSSHSNPIPFDSAVPEPDQAIALLAKLDRDLGQLKHVQRRQQREVARLLAQRQNLDEAEAELVRRGQALTALNDQVNAEKRELESAREALAQQETVLTQRERELAQRQAALDEREALAAVSQGELAHLREQLCQEHAAVERDSAEAQRKLDELERQKRLLDQAAAALLRQSRELAAWGSDLARRQEDLAAWEAEVDEHRQRCVAQAGTDLSEREAALAVRLAALEQRETEDQKRRAQVEAKEMQLRKLLHLGRRRLTQQQERLRDRRLLTARRLREIRKRAAAAAVVVAAPIMVPAPRPAPEPAETSDLTQQVRQLGEQRRMLAEVRTALEASERQMIERWAVQRAGGLVVAVCVMVALVLGVSHMAAVRLNRPLYRASAVVTPSQEAMEGRAGEDGATLLRQRLLDAAVLREAQSYLAFRGVEIHDAAQSLASQLQQFLRVTPVGDRVYRVTWLHGRPEHAATVLDALARAYVSWDQVQHRAAGAANKAQVTTAATADPLPAVDQYPQLLARLAGGGGAGCVVLWLLGYLLLRRSQSVLDRRKEPALELLEAGG